MNGKYYLFPIAPPIDGSCWATASSFTYQGGVLSCFWRFWHYWYLNISRSELNVQLSWSNKRRVIIVFNCNISSFASKFCSIIYLIRNKCKLSRSIVISGCIDWRKFSLATKPFQSCKRIAGNRSAGYSLETTSRKNFIDIKTLNLWRSWRICKKMKKAKNINN